jgi:hypothetical protein
MSIQTALLPQQDLKRRIRRYDFVSGDESYFGDHFHVARFLAHHCGSSGCCGRKIYRHGSDGLPVSVRRIPVNRSSSRNRLLGSSAGLCRFAGVDVVNAYPWDASSIIPNEGPLSRYEWLLVLSLEVPLPRLTEKRNVDRD